MVRIDLVATAFAVLPVIVGGHAIGKSATPDWIQWLQHHDLIKDGKVAIPYENDCGIKDDPKCMDMRIFASSLNDAESALFCTLHTCSNQLLPKYDSKTGLCQCPRVSQPKFRVCVD